MLIADALAALEVDTLLLGIADRSLPAAPDEDAGAGALDSRGGRAFLEWVRALGFTGVRLLPQGETTASNPSPYDGTIFSRGRLGLAVAQLAEEQWGSLLDPAVVVRLVATRPTGPEDRVQYRHAHAAHGEALAAAYAAFSTRRRAGDATVADLAARFEAFRVRARDWLEADAWFEALREEYGDDVHAWPAGALPGSRGGEGPARWAFAQFVLHEQHREARAFARRLGLELWGDLQIGLSARDIWARQDLFLEDYRLGAPPSRTNPEGQPWNYPVLDPDNPAGEELVSARLDKMFAEYDGVRIDHPHGFVCPWVYRVGGDPGVAVRAGARLFAAPDLPDHPRLARFAIARRDQLNPDPRTPRYADDWVLDLEPAQIDRYGRLMDAIVAAARRCGRDTSALACEILSTCPYPLRRVLERHRLGRFRVTQKADLSDPADGYRSEHAQPADWIMVGTHDTPPLWKMLEQWEGTSAIRDRAAYLAWRLAPDDAARGTLAARLAGDPGLLAQACFADLFASRARHVVVFFTDAFGLREVFNRPGIIDEVNWTLRLPPRHRDLFRARLREDRALNLPLALALALRARGLASGEHAALVAQLEAEAAAWRRGDCPR